MRRKRQEEILNVHRRYISRLALQCLSDPIGTSFVASMEALSAKIICISTYRDSLFSSTRKTYAKASQVSPSSFPCILYISVTLLAIGSLLRGFRNSIQGYERRRTLASKLDPSIRVRNSTYRLDISFF